MFMQCSRVHCGMHERIRISWRGDKLFMPISERLDGRVDAVCRQHVPDSCGVRAPFVTLDHKQDVNVIVYQ